MPDTLIRSLDRDANIRVVAADTTELVRDAVLRHRTDGLGACALGRGLTAGLLLATLTKGNERVTIQIRGDGPLGGLVIDANDDGDVRGYLMRELDEPRPAVPPDRPMVAAVLGRTGIINVLRDLGLKERYAGQIALVTGEIDEDVEAYLRTSEQVPSALGCEVVLDQASPAGVGAATGVLVQAMPGAEVDAPAIRAVQHEMRTGGLYELVRAGVTAPFRLAQAIYGGSLDLLEERSLRFRCRCTPDRVSDMLGLLTTVDLDEMLADQGRAEVTCNFCGRQYVVERAELEAVRERVARGPRSRN